MLAPGIVGQGEAGRASEGAKDGRGKYTAGRGRQHQGELKGIYGDSGTERWRFYDKKTLQIII